jgi:hypothetical protein
MSNPTTPFSWQMPTATDLVTDLPADFEVFGQAVATSMADLLGGTSGQILAKNSNTDMDFVWVANDQGDITGVTAGNGISVTDPTGPVPTVAINTAVTADLTTAQTLTNKTLTSPVLTTPSISNINAKADLLVGTADNTLGILSVGTNGQVLTADSTVSPTGLKWAAASSGSIVLLNRTTFSAVSSQSINSVFSSTYTNYQVIINGYSSALADMKFNYRLSGTDATANSYRSAIATYDDLGNYAFIGGTATFLKLGKIVDSSTQRSVWNMIVAEPTANNRKGLSFTGWNGQTKIYWGGGDYIGSDASAYDGFTLSCSTGTMTGSVAVYGWKES